MFSFIMTVIILLPPTNVASRAHRLTSFNIQSTSAYANKIACMKAIEKTADYIRVKLPKANVSVEAAECSKSEVEES